MRKEEDQNVRAKEDVLLVLNIEIGKYQFERMQLL